MPVKRATKLGATRNGHQPVWGSGGGTGSGTPGSASPMLLDLPAWNVDQVLWTPGLGGNYGSVADHADLDITGDLTLVGEVALKDYTPGAVQSLASKRQGASDNAWELSLRTDGKVGLQHFADGSTGLFQTSTVSLTTVVSDRDVVRVAAELDVDDGAGNHIVRFWYSLDRGVTWSQLGADIVVAGTTSVFASTADIAIGCRLDNSFPALGAYLYWAVHSGLLVSGAATTVLTCEFSDPTVVDGDVSTTAEGHTLTINRSGNAQAELVRQPCLAVSASDEDWQLPSRDAWLPDDGPAGIAVGAKVRGFVNSGGMLAKGNWNSAAPRFGLIGRETVGGVRFEVANDSGVFSSVDAPIPTGEWMSILAEHDPGVANKIYSAGVEVGTVADAGGTVNPTGNVHAFQLPSFATLVQVGLYRWTMFLRRLLTEAERTELAAWDGSIAAEPSWLRDAATFYWHAADPAASTAYRLRNEVVNLAGDPHGTIPAPYRGPERIRHLGHTSVRIPA